MKKCSKCLKEKPFAEFPKKGQGRLASECKQCKCAYAKERRLLHGDKVREIGKKSFRKARMEALTHYGGNPPKCVCCKEGTYEFLAIDHINNDGAVQRKIIGNNCRLYFWLRKNNYPKGFQILCHNCNLAKGFYGQCPHNNG